jgi:hypothetical protein
MLANVIVFLSYPSSMHRFPENHISLLRKAYLFMTTNPDHIGPFDQTEIAVQYLKTASVYLEVIRCRVVFRSGLLPPKYDVLRHHYR